MDFPLTYNLLTLQATISQTSAHTDRFSSGAPALWVKNIQYPGMQIVDVAANLTWQTVLFAACLPENSTSQVNLEIREHMQ
jgi:hypothetical protein